MYSVTTHVGVAQRFRIAARVRP